MLKRLDNEGNGFNEKMKRDEIKTKGIGNNGDIGVVEYHCWRMR